MDAGQTLLIERIHATCGPESLVELLRGLPGVILLRGGLVESAEARYSWIGARPFLDLRCFGERCELRSPGRQEVQFGNPWQIIAKLIARYELPENAGCAFPLGGCFGHWGYGLKRFVEPRLPQRALDDLHLPDCHVGFYSTLAVFDHWLSEIWVVATGLEAGGSRDARRARAEVEFWRELLEAPTTDERPAPVGEILQGALLPFGAGGVRSNLAQSEFVERVERAQAYIRAGDIYQVNLSHRLTAPWGGSGWNLFRSLSAASPAPYAAYMDGGDYELASTSPELFLRMDGANIQTRPIKGTRPRGSDPEMDTQLAQELEVSPKENAELVMITDLLRNDLGKVCEYGSISVSRLAGLERYRHVQHLVSTIQGRLAPGQTHLAALAACFPGGSVTGAPKIRAMEIIDELEPVARGPYTGALGYLGFNGKSQLSMVIRAAICARGLVHFQVGAGIVADSVPGEEYEETLVKARGFLGRMPPWQGGCVGRAPTAAIGPGRPTP